MRRKPLAKLCRMIRKGSRDKEGMLKWPVIENERAERGCRMRDRDPGGGSWCTVSYMKISRKRGIGSMEILYNQ